MAHKFITIRIDDKIHKRFKVICAEMNILLGKQTEALIVEFVRMQEYNVERMKESMKE
jgi:antitoxin component of RelBE/YafQ-DinJ toxin-antitoxin module